ncbi:MAG TPA: carbohydrate ABC transporter permease [bacterium]|nr:carbohydrate ABC transporter permease [bacterium]
MASGSLKTPAEIFGFPPTLIPDRWNWQNFIEIFRYQPFARQYGNSLYIAALVTLGTLCVSTPAGYAFARIRFRGNTVLFLLLLTTLMMPAEVTIIPNFFLMKFLGLVNTHVPLILLPILGANGVVSTFLIRQFFLSFPQELEDAAMIDGLGRFGVFWYVGVPLVKPALGAVSILTFLYSWNLFLEPLVFINDLRLFTLPLALNNFADAYGVPVWHLQLAATTLSVLPVLAVYVLAQRRIVDSFVLSGMKG